MPQFFVAPEDIQKKSFRLTGPEAFHVVKAGATAALHDALPSCNCLVSVPN